MKHELTLSKAWDKTIKQWAFIEKRMCDKYHVHDLKMLFIRRHYKWNTPLNGCYFCEYAKKKYKGQRYVIVYLTDCSLCPGRLIDPKFHCENKEYHWQDKPLEFHKKIQDMYRRYKNG